MSIINELVIAILFLYLIKLTIGDGLIIDNQICDYRPFQQFRVGGETSDKHNKGASWSQVKNAGFHQIAIDAVQILFSS